MFLRVFAIGFAVVGIAAAMKPVSPPARNSEAAVVKALPLLEHSGEYWFKSRQCVSCHHQALMQVTAALASERGFKVQKRLNESRNSHVEKRLESNRLARYEGFGSINGNITFAYGAWGSAAAGIGPNDNTDATVVLLLQKQARGGNWPSYSHRPPIEDSTFTATAMAIKALKVYAPSTFRKDATAAVERAGAWLRRAEPQSNEDATFQLMGLVWAGVPKLDIQRRVAVLLGQQNEDGGWSQFASRPSDAYATGEALVALSMAGQDVKSSSYQKGVRYLLDTQKMDGSWLVTTRRVLPGLPYFESGFPHGKHQFISFAGTAWASMALMIDATQGKNRALMDTQWRGDNRHRAALAKSKPVDRLLKAALWGTLADMKKAVASGAPIEGKSLSGATALTYAVRQPEKVAWLLSKGANVNAVSDEGTTPFLLASEYVGSEKPFELMLKAKPNLKAKVGDFFNPIGMAASTASVGRVRKLLAMGTKAGVFQLTMAYTSRQFETMEVLCNSGINLEEPVDEFKETILCWAIQDGSAEGVEILLKHGANPNVVTTLGLTPLMMAAMFNYGSGRITEQLLQRGANPDARTKEGKTALGLAKKYDHRPAIQVLER